MAVYKVIQDIESEDKLLGPLTLKGFIYFAIAGVLAFVSVRLLISGAPIYLRLALVFILFFPTALFGVLASPLGRDQPTEVWLLAHIRFLIKPKGRIWDQAGLDNLVTITVPKRLDMHLSKGFSQNEVQNRLQALATTLDSRGWVVKNSAVNLNEEPENESSDRLIAPSSVAQPGQVIDVHASDDIMDEQNNATAQHFNELMQQADDQRKQKVAEKMDQARQDNVDSDSEDTRFIDASTRQGTTTFVGRAVVTPQDDDSESDSGSDEPLTPETRALLEHEHERDAEIHRRSANFQTRASREAAVRAREATAKRQAQEEKARLQAVTAAQAAAKLELAQSGNDLSVASIAHLANRAGQAQQISPNEVVISLH